MIARILGSSLLGFALAFWWIKDDMESHTLRAVIGASFIYNLLDLPIVIMASATGLMNLMGWVAVGLHVFLAAGFGYFSFNCRPK